MLLLVRSETMTALWPDKFYYFLYFLISGKLYDSIGVDTFLRPNGLDVLLFFTD